MATRRISLLRSGESRRYYLLYTLFFVLTSFLVFHYYLFSGLTFIWKSDGLTQHYTAFVYYGKYLRKVIRTLLHTHRLLLPSFDFTLGEGADILQTLNYYVIGDPFALFSVFFPESHAAFGYDALILLRLYLAGIAFSRLCFEFGQNKTLPVLSGAMNYVFFQWMLLNACRHPFFLNPLIYLPLIVIGLERIFRGKRPYLYILSIVLSAVSNFYFFYILALLTVIYALVRVFEIYRRDLRSACLTVLRIGGLSLLSMGISALILLPVLRFFLTCTRLGSGSGVSLFYPLDYYFTLPSVFLTYTPGRWLNLGFAAPSFLALCLLFYRKKEHRPLKTLFLISAVIILFPFFGSILNGLSYSTNRWSFALALPVSYCLVVQFENVCRLTEKELRLLFRCLLIYLFVCLILQYSRGEQIFFVFALLFALLLLFHPGALASGRPLLTEEHRQTALFLSVLLSISLNSFFFNSFSENNYSAECLSYEDIKRDAEGEIAFTRKAVAEDLDARKFFRITGHDSRKNIGTAAGLPYTNYFWSISDPSADAFFTSLELENYLPYLYTGYDERAALMSLSGVKYYVAREGDEYPVPYGFSEIPSPDGSPAASSASSGEDSWRIYRNRYALPLGYCYDSAISRTEWEKLSATAREESMLQDVVLEEFPDSFVSKTKIGSRKLPFTITFPSDNVTLENGCFVTTEKNAKIVLQFDPVEKSRLYFSMKGLEFTGTAEYDLYLGPDSVDPLGLYDRESWQRLHPNERRALRMEKLYWRNPNAAKLTLTPRRGLPNSFFTYTSSFNWYRGPRNITLNLGPSSGVSSITIKFSQIGTYRFDSMDLEQLPMGDYAAQIGKLRENVLKNVRIGTDSVTGRISLSEPEILCLSIPYSDGWTAFVDGKETELLQANVRHMALLLDAGKHQIELRYRTPLLREGAVVSACSLGALAVYVFFEERRRRRTDHASSPAPAAEADGRP